LTLASDRTRNGVDGEPVTRKAVRYNSGVSSGRSILLDRYLRQRRVWEAGLWSLYWLAQALAGSVVSLMDIRRNGLPFQSWEPFVWEFSSCMVLLALVPAVIAFERRVPLQFATWRRALPWHVLASIVFSVVHVMTMVAIRKAAYAVVGGEYDFGDWWRELGYEYVKDGRTYAGILIVINLYRLLLLRLQGEARLLVAPESGPAVEPIQRPQRFLVRKLGSEFLIAASDIEWLEAAENYVNLHVRGHVYPLRSTMSAIEEHLDPARFARVHRRFIVNLDHLSKIEPLDSGDARLVLKDGTVIGCSRRYRNTLREQAVLR
jgi:hypothetical protein